MLVFHDDPVVAGACGGQDGEQRGLAQQDATRYPGG